MAELAANKETSNKPKMVLINGVLVPAATVTLNKNSAANAGQQSAKVSGRSAFFNSMMDRLKQKSSKNFDLAQLQSTFKTQDLHSKKKEELTVVDALAHELEKGPADDNDVDVFDDDEQFGKAAPADATSNGHEKSVDVVPQHNWDDEENIKSITEGDLADCVQSSVDVASLNLKSSGKATPPGKAPSHQSKHEGNESMEEAEIAEALLSNESSLGAGSLLRRKEIELANAAIARRKQKAQAAARFLDIEADLGSDNEENDDRVKKINKDDVEEDEEGLDDSLDGFVDHDVLAGDDQEIVAGNEAARELYLAK